MFLKLRMGLYFRRLNRGLEGLASLLFSVCNCDSGVINTAWGVSSWRTLMNMQTLMFEKVTAVVLFQHMLLRCAPASNACLDSPRMLLCLPPLLLDLPGRRPRCGPLSHILRLFRFVCLQITRFKWLFPRHWGASGIKHLKAIGRRLVCPNGVRVTLVILLRFRDFIFLFSFAGKPQEQSEELREKTPFIGKICFLAAYQLLLGLLQSFRHWSHTRITLHWVFISTMFQL